MDLTQREMNDNDPFEQQLSENYYSPYFNRNSGLIALKVTLPCMK
jgi:hypothetical protein